MAAVAYPLISGRWQSQTPESYFKTLRRRLIPTWHAILGVIWSDHNCAPHAKEEKAKTPRTIEYYAHWANCSLSMAAKALAGLVAKGLVKKTRKGRYVEYEPIPENFGTESEERKDLPKRTCRKPPQTSQIMKRTQGEQEQSLEKVKVLEMKPVTETNPVLHYIGREEDLAGEPAPVKTGPSDGGGNESQDAGLEKFLIQTISPLLASCPPKNVIADTLRVLGDAPVEMLESRVSQRKEGFKKHGWSLLKLLAADVRDTHVALRMISPERERYNLDRHWSSCSEVRRMISDSATPTPIRSELLSMWPELDAKQRKVTTMDKVEAILKARQK